MVVGTYQEQNKILRALLYINLFITNTIIDIPVNLYKNTDTYAAYKPHMTLHNIGWLRPPWLSTHYGNYKAHNQKCA